MAKRTNRFLLWQKVVVGVIAVIGVGLMTFLYSMVITEAPGGEFVEGHHYLVLDEPRRVRGDKIEVMEFFSYGCVHCFNFDPELNQWVARNADRITFVRTPAIGSNYWRILGRAYYTMKALGVLDENHEALFNEIHNARKQMDSVDLLASWIDGQGTSSTAFRSMFNSGVVDRDVEVADQLARRMLIASVPTIIVNGKYMVRITADVGPARMLEVMDYLLEKELAPAPNLDPAQSSSD